MSDTIKYHINLPVDTSEYKLPAAQNLVKQALTGFNILSIDTWVATLGAAGYRVSVIFNPPTPANAEALVVPVYKALVAAGWTLDGPVTAWIHP